MNDYPLTYASLADIERRRMVDKPLFGLGRPLATPAALEILMAAQHHPARLLQRHQCGEWGSLCGPDKTANDEALISGSRLLSAYEIPDGIKIYVITEAVNDEARRRETTTILLADEY